MTTTNLADWQFARRPFPAEFFYWADVPLLMAPHLGRLPQSRTFHSM